MYQFAFSLYLYMDEISETLIFLRVKNVVSYGECSIVAKLASCFETTEATDMYEWETMDCIDAYIPADFPKRNGVHKLM